MAYRSKRGMGSVIAGQQPLNQCDIPFAAWFKGECWSQAWDGLFGPSNPVRSVAPVPAPTGSVLTTPPASGAAAEAVIDDLVNQQAAAQKELDAQQVQSGVLDQLSSGVVTTAGALASGTSWILIGAIGIGIFALIAMGAGSPRRYGR